jgi:hypothetical protein
MNSDEMESLPVFVNPQTLQFPIDDITLHKQTLTLYNPYEFNIRFKLLSTAPFKYKLSQTSGMIRSKHYVDLMVRHLTVSANEFGTTDHLRVEIMREGDYTTSIGHKDIQLSVVQHLSRNPVPETTMFRSFTNPNAIQSDSSSSSRKGDNSKRVSFINGQPDARQRIIQQDNRLLNIFLMFLVAFCGITIMVPTYEANAEIVRSNEGFVAQLIPLHQRPTPTQQLLGSFCLGCCIVILFYQNLRL